MHEGNFALQMAEMITAAPDAKAAFPHFEPYMAFARFLLGMQVECAFLSHPMFYSLDKFSHHLTMVKC